MKIIRSAEAQAALEALREASFEAARLRSAQSGIRRSAGGWAAIRDGRLVDEYVGVGSKRSAIEAAGTNAVIS